MIFWHWTLLWILFSWFITPHFHWSDNTQYCLKHICFDSPSSLCFCNFAELILIISFSLFLLGAFCYPFLIIMKWSVTLLSFLSKNPAVQNKPGERDCAINLGAVLPQKAEKAFGIFLEFKPLSLPKSSQWCSLLHDVHLNCYLFLINWKWTICADDNKGIHLQLYYHSHPKKWDGFWITTLWRDYKGKSDIQINFVGLVLEELY